MRKKRNRTVAMILTVTMAVTLFGGCEKKPTADNLDKQVKLKWIMLGDKQKDANLVWNKFNENLQKYVANTEVEFEMIPGSSYEKKWQLMNAASEQIDIAWTGYAISSLVGEVEKGSYLALDDLIKENAENIEKELPKWLLDLGRVNGEIYEIPNYQMMASGPFGIHTTKELADKYMNIPAIQSKFKEWEKEPENDKTAKEFFGLFEDFLAKVKADGKINKGIGLGSIQGFDPYTDRDLTTINGFTIDTKTKKIVVDFLEPNKKIWFDTVSDWYKKGYIRNDIMSENVDGIDEAEKGYILWGHGYFNKTSESSESLQKGFPTRVFGLGDTYRIKNNISATSTALGRTCVNPQRAIKVVELMHTKKGKDMYNLLAYGIEGKHYKKISENRIKTLDYETQANSDSPYGIADWSLGNTSNSYENQGDAEGQAQYIESLDKNAQILDTVGFKPDTTTISVEIAQIKSVTEEYKALSYGALPNYEQVYNEYIAKLKSAGVEKVRDELQKQLDEWIKNKN